MEIAISIIFVVIAIGAIAGFGYWFYFRKKVVDLPSESKPKEPSVQKGKPTIRVMNEEEIAAWAAMEISPSDIRILETAYGNVIMPSDIDHRTTRLNEILVQQGFRFSLDPAEMVGCLADELALHRQKKQSSLPMIALFRYANAAFRRKYKLGMNIDLNPEQLKELQGAIKELGDQASAKKEGITPGFMTVDENAGRPAGKKNGERPALTKTPKELAELQARHQTNKIIKELPKPPSADERQAIFAEQWKIALAEVAKRYGG